jgi:hypothetical protein
MLSCLFSCVICSKIIIISLNQPAMLLIKLRKIPLFPTEIHISGWNVFSTFDFSLFSKIIIPL